MTKKNKKKNKERKKNPGMRLGDDSVSTTI